MNDDCLRHRITDNLVLQIDRLNNYYSLLYFTDENHKKISMPDQVIVYECDSLNNNYRIALNTLSGTNAYTLVFSERYKIEFCVEQKIQFIELQCKNNWIIS